MYKDLANYSIGQKDEIGTTSFGRESNGDYSFIIRGVILKGPGFSDLWRETAVLLMMGIAILFFSAKRFHKSWNNPG